MSWARIDDGFDDHPKVLWLLEHDDGVAAIGLWTLCLTWAYRNTRKQGKIPGRLPASLPRRYLGIPGRDAAKLLIDADLWEIAENGYQIHDFELYLPTAETSEARSEAGRKGAAARWAKNGKAAARDSKLPSGHGKPLASGMANDGNAMAPDGQDAAEGAQNDAPDAGDDGQPPGDGKLPFSDSNEPSGDGKAMASDGSRAPARRAIPNGIAPVPDPDPGGVQGGESPKTPKNRRGSRIPDDFRVTTEMVAWARRRAPHVDGRLETEKFTNHWTSSSGRNAVKLDWNRAWMNWMLTAEERAGRPRGQPGGGSASDVSHLEEWKRNRS
jgi:hypothetical protein